MPPVVDKIMAVRQTCTPRARGCILLLLIAFTVYLLIPYQSENIHHLYEEVRLGRKAAFIETAITTAIDGPYGARPIQSLCASKNWTEGLIFSCKAPQGGVGNVRNVVLNCVRYAIEAGAAFVVPQINARSESDLTVLTTNKRGLSYFFDLEIFMASLEEGCPQMKVYRHLNDLFDLPTTAVPFHLAPQQLSREFIHRTVLAHPSEWRGDFDKWLQLQTTSISRGLPVLVELDTPLLQFPLSYDVPAFVAHFGRMLPFRADTRRLAAAALFELSQEFSLNINPAVGIMPQAFMGAHLRTAADASAAGWMGYDEQASAYISQTLAANIPVIYVSSGSPDDIARLQKQGSLSSVNVTSKMHLLSAEEQKLLNALTWDQQALVDYEVLLKSSTFGGILASSFAWNIALRRNLLTSKQEYLHGNGGATFQDDLSWLYGPSDFGPSDLSDMCQFSMWP